MICKYYRLNVNFRKLHEDYPKYCKSSKLSIVLARYLREFLYVYRELYQGYPMVTVFFLIIHFIFHTNVGVLLSLLKLNKKSTELKL